MIAIEAAPAVVLAAIVVVAVQRAVDAPAFLPQTLTDVVAVIVTVGGAAYAGWRWLIKPLKRVDELHEKELRRQAQHVQNLWDKVDHMKDDLRDMGHERDSVKRDVDRLATRFEGLTTRLHDESEKRDEQHSETMGRLGEIVGQLKRNSGS